MVRGGRFSARLPIPKHVQGLCHVRVFVQASRNFAIGSADITIRPLKIQSVTERKTP
jgi:hypothetical protein